MQPNQLYIRSLTEFDQLVKTIAANQWSLPTPDTEWNVRDLVNHVTGEDLWCLELLAGKTIAEVGDRFDGDVLGQEPHQTWGEIAPAVKAAAQEADLNRVVHLSFGDVAASEYLNQMFSDHLVHSWDLAHALGQKFEPDQDLVEACYNFLLPQAEEWSRAGSFGPAVTVTANADSLTRLLALTGRKNN